MERGELYRVIYTEKNWRSGEDDWEKVKQLVFIKKDGKLVEFYNPDNFKTEILNEVKIVRMEIINEGKENGRNKPA